MNYVSGDFFMCSPQVTVSGFLAGDGASRAGMAYKVNDCCTSDRVNGAIAYKKQ
jgi:hypothetical protein